MSVVPPPAQTPSSTTKAPSAPSKVPILPNQSFESVVELAEALEAELKMPMRFLETGCVLVTPVDQEMLQALLAVHGVQGNLLD